MLCTIASILALTCLYVVRPETTKVRTPSASFGAGEVDSYIVGGQDADPGEWPWQLLMEHGNGSFWTNHCGAILLTETKALTAASACIVDYDYSPSQLRVVAGVHDRTDFTGAQIAYISDYVIHENYTMNPVVSHDNDIAMLYLASAIIVGGNVQLATLPPDNSDNFGRDNCTLIGWGYIIGGDSAETFSVRARILQEVEIMAMNTTKACNILFSGLSTVWDKQICFYDPAEEKGSCAFDYGGPANCPDGAGGYYVAGIASFFIMSVGDPPNGCTQRYPQVYTRISAYLDWINSH